MAIPNGCAAGRRRGPREPGTGPGRDAAGGDVVSRAHLAQVRAEVGDEALRRYARAYLDLLPDRLARIEQALAAADYAEATRVMFDLRVSSEMLGTTRLGALITELEAAPRLGLPADAVQLARVRTEALLVAAVVRAAMDGDGLGGPGSGAGPGPGPGDGPGRGPDDGDSG